MQHVRKNKWESQNVSKHFKNRHRGHSSGCLCWGQCDGWCSKALKSRSKKWKKHYWRYGRAVRDWMKQRFIDNNNDNIFDMNPLHDDHGNYRMRKREYFMDLSDVFEQTQTKQINRKRRKKHKTKSLCQGRKVSKEHLYIDDDNGAEYLIEATKYRSMKQDQHKNEIIKQRHMTSMKRIYDSRLFDVEISLKGIKHSEYEHLKKRYFINESDDTFFINVMIKMINIQIDECCIKIMDRKSKKLIKKFTFLPKLQYKCFVPIYFSDKAYIYKHDFMTRYNQRFISLIRTCLHELSDCNLDKMNNLNVCLWNLSDLLFECLPVSISYLNGVLCEFVGYNEAINVQSKVTKIRMFDQFERVRRKTAYSTLRVNRIESSDDFEGEMNRDVDDDYRSSLDRSFFAHTPKQKALNGHIDCDSKDKVVLFRIPYRYRQNYALIDDEKRDENWWRAVKYEQNKFEKMFKIGGVVLYGYASLLGHRRTAKIIDTRIIHNEDNYEKYEICVQSKSAWNEWCTEWICPQDIMDRYCNKLRAIKRPTSKIISK